MPLLHCILVLLVVGVLLWVVTTVIPLDPTIRQILIAVVVLAVVLWLLQGFGVVGMSAVGAPHRGG